MADGVLGEDTLHALRAVELDVKQKPVVVQILHHLKGEINATDHQPNQETVTPKPAQVCILPVVLDSSHERIFIII